MELCLIVAVANNGVIGASGTLPWHLSSDLRRFKALTMGQTIVMGRRTHESIGRALPGRQNIVVTRRQGLDSEGIEVAQSLDEALDLAQSNHVFVIGGAQLYEEALPRADRVLLTRVLAEVEGDTYFPLEQLDQWTLEQDQFHAATDKDDFDFRVQTYVRYVERNEK